MHPSGPATHSTQMRSPLPLGAALLVAIVLPSLLLSAGALPAQVTVHASAATPLEVRARALQVQETQTLPAGTPLGVDFRLDAVAYDVASGIRSTAATEMQIDTSPERIEIIQSEAARGGFSLLGQGSAGFGRHIYRYTFTSPVPIAARLTLDCCGTATQSSGSIFGVADVDGTRALTLVSQATGCFGGFAQSATVPVTVGPNGVVLELDTGGSGIGSLRGGFGYGAALWRIRLTPDPDFPCAVTSYGPSCGATLTASPDLRFPGMHRITLTDASQPTAAFLAIGLQRVDVPLLGCRILTDNVIVDAWAIDPTGTATTLFLPPPALPPGTVLTLQGATLDTAFHTTNGLELRCR